MTDPPAKPPLGVPSSASPTQPLWPGARRRGTTRLVGGGSAFGAGALLAVLGPNAGLLGFFFGGLLGLLVGGIVLVIGLIRYVRGGFASPPVKRWQAAVVGAATPVVVALMIEVLALTSG